MIDILTVIQTIHLWTPYKELVGEFYPCILVFIVVFYSTWLYHMYTIIHACILLFILVFYVLAQYEMLVFCNPLSKCPSATPFLFLLAGTQYYFFMDKTKQFLYVFVNIVNTSCSLETTIVIWFLDMVTVKVYGKTTKWMVDLL